MKNIRDIMDSEETLLKVDGTHTHTHINWPIFQAVCVNIKQLQISVF
jgi:hypothetical protein